MIIIDIILIIINNNNALLLSLLYTLLFDKTSPNKTWDNHYLLFILYDTSSIIIEVN